MRMQLDVRPTGRTTATVILSQEQVDAIRGVPGNARVMLAIAYGGAVYRTSISIYRGQWMMVVNQAMREGGLVPGAVYDCEVSVDTAERTIDVPADLQAALDAAGVADAFARKSFTQRKEWVRGVADAKKPETRTARIAKVIAAFSG